MKLSKKITIVTGASTGIGKRIALTFAQEGAEVLLVARSRDRLDKVREEILKVNGNAAVYVVDLSSVDEINNFIKIIINDYKKIDQIINVAGIWHDDKRAFYDIDFDKYDQKVVLDTFSVGLLAPILFAHGLLPLMSKGSDVINISGTFENGAKGGLPYYVSKKALEDFTIGLSQEVKDKEIYVNCISPSDTATEE